jgi:hypothetical protein
MRSRRSASSGASAAPREAERLSQRVRRRPAALRIAARLQERPSDGELGRGIGDRVGEEVAQAAGSAGRVGPVAQPAEPPCKNGLQQRRLGREMPEHRADPHAGQTRDLLGRGSLAARAEHLVGDSQDQLPVGGGVATARAAIDIGVGTPYLLRSHHSAS